MSDQRPCHSIPPTAQNICAIFVSFNPDSSFKANLQSVINQVDHVIVVDNASTGSSILPVQETDVELIRNDENLGIATALNIGIDRAKSLGYQWVLTMDQDTTAHGDLIDGLRAVYDSYPDRHRAGTLAANFIDSNRNRLFAGTPGGPATPGGPVTPGGPATPGTPGTSHLYIEQAVAITAGSLIPMAALNDVGLFRGEFFIDFVDHEFSLRLGRRGWKIIYSRRPLIDHQIGAPVRHHFLWMRPTTSNHSALRRYYITRNRLITAAEYLDSHPRAVITDLCRVAGEAIAVMAFEPDRIEKFKAMVAGLGDAIVRRGGPRRQRDTAGVQSRNRG